MIYRIYTSVNYADTLRDADNIHIKELDYIKGEREALKYLDNYVKNNFSRPSELYKDKKKEIIQY